MNWWIYKSAAAKHDGLIDRLVRKSLLWKSLLLGALILAILGAASFSVAVEIPNPIGEKSFFGLIERIASALRSIALVFAPVALIFAGFKFVTAATSGNERALGEAKKMFFWILIGVTVVIAASVLAKAIVNFAETL